MIENIAHNDQVLAIIIRHSFCKDGIHFFTPDNYSQQLAYMKRPKDYSIPPHVHNAVPREVQFTQEVLIIKSGKIRVDFYDDNQQYLQSTFLNAGDVVLLAFGGHGFEMIEESEIIEVKQGPYAGEMDKVRFQPIGKDQLEIKE